MRSFESRKLVRLKAQSLIFTVFILGALSGAALDRIFVLRAGVAAVGKGRGRMLDGMQKDLNLSAEQMKTVKQITEASRNEFREQMLRCPAFQAHRQQTNERVRALLTPEQQGRFDELDARGTDPMKAKRQ